MPEVNVKPQKGTSISDFLSFKGDLEFLLKRFPAQKLADWLGMNKGNLSKKINGKDGISDRFIQHFNEVMEYPVLLLHQGKTAQEVEAEMERGPEERVPGTGKVRVSVFDQAIGKVVEGMLDIQTKVLEVEERNEKNEKEIGGIKIVLAEHDREIKELRQVVFRPEGPRKAS